MPFAGMINNYGLSNLFSSSWFTINTLRVARGDGDEQDENGIKWWLLHFFGKQWGVEKL
jgi:hypothetical protein